MVNIPTIGDGKRHDVKEMHKFGKRITKISQEKKKQKLRENLPGYSGGKLSDIGPHGSQQKSMQIDEQREC